jgi:DNA-binding transcriptional ArsR family regulator
MSETINRDFKGVWIPKEIWLNESLSVFEKCLAAEIDSLDGEEGCFASNEYLCKFFNVKERTLSQALTKLKNMGIIELAAFDGRRRVLKTVKANFYGSAQQKTESNKHNFTGLGSKNLLPSTSRVSLYESKDYILQQHPLPPQGGRAFEADAEKPKPQEKPQEKPKEPDPSPCAETTEARTAPPRDLDEYGFLHLLDLSDADKMRFMRFPVRNVQEAVACALEAKKVDNMARYISSALKNDYKPEKQASMPFCKTDVMAWIDHMNKRMKKLNRTNHYHVDGFDFVGFEAEYIEKNNAMMAVPVEKRLPFLTLFDPKVREFYEYECDHFSSIRKAREAGDE